MSHEWSGVDKGLIVFEEDGVQYGIAMEATVLSSLLRLASGCVMLQSHIFPRYMGPMPPLWLSPSRLCVLYSMHAQQCHSSRHVSVLHTCSITLFSCQFHPMYTASQPSHAIL